MADELPLLHDRYRLLRKLGSGAFATVYLADDLQLGRQVAVKVVEDETDVDGRALREARAAAKLSHPHIMTVFEVTRETSRTLLISEYIEGETLRQLFARRRLSDAQLLEAGIQIGRALEHAHRRGVVHRDIKPENVMLLATEGVDVRVMDFGVARLEDLSSITLDGDVVGTLAYMAPEQLEGRPVDARADVYSLALTLYEGFTGKNPLRGKHPAELLRAPTQMVFARLSRARPDLPLSLEDALEQGLRYDPALRPDAASFRRLLERALKEMPVPEEHVGLVERTLVRLAPSTERTERLLYFGRHLVAGLAALGTLVWVLPRVPFYPASWIIPVAVTIAFLALLWPGVGGAAGLVALGPPVFAFSLGWGFFYLVAAGGSYGLLRWRHREWAVLVPGVAPLLAGVGVGLALPALCGLFLRRWGVLVAMLAGTSIALVAGFAGWALLPYVYSAGPGPVLLAGRHVGSVAEVWRQIVDFMHLRPELLLQIALFGVFGLPLARFYRGPAVARLWAAAAYLSLLFVAYVAVVPLVTGAAVGLGRFALAYVPCAIIVLLLALLNPTEDTSAA